MRFYLDKKTKKVYERVSSCNITDKKHLILKDENCKLIAKSENEVTEIKYSEIEINFEATIISKDKIIYKCKRQTKEIL